MSDRRASVGSWFVTAIFTVAGLIIELFVADLEVTIMASELFFIAC
jgi:hypothetical protein